ncbi:MAG: 7TM-DISM domain-containing protein [Hydrogenophaga sp.]|nr:7TM-DISM domain-containing protein [Hydrogenophaga sp.]
MTFLVRLCALCALLLSLHAAHAQPGPQPAPLSLDGSKSTLSLAGRSSFWVDGGGQLTVDQLEQLQAELPFSIRNRDNRLQLGPGAVLWVKFDARVVDTGTQWELELTHAGTDLVSLFHRQADGSWKAQHAGDRIAVRDWAYPDRYPVFALDPRADQTVTYWVRIEHARVPFSGELLVHNHSALRELRIQQQFLLGA